MRTKPKATRHDETRPNRKPRSPRRASIQRYLFVYGTLKRGGKSHKLLLGENGARFRSSARIRAELYRLCGEDYPAAVLTSVPNRFVKGDLFVLQDPQGTLRDLDEFEGVNEGLFRRELVDAWARGRRVKAWAYLYARPVRDASLIPTGIYSSH
jgi:gamma-glutamylcyclotransferase (GGCT)/AIG2-like uncharacterized protein YtfP